LQCLLDNVSTKMYAIYNSLESWLYLLNLLINTYVREIHFHDNKWKVAPCENKLLYSNTFVDSYSDFLNRAKTLSQRLLDQSYVQPFLLSSLQKLYGRHHDIIERYEVLVSQMRINIFRLYVSPDLTLLDLTPPGLTHLQCDGCCIRSRTCLPIQSTWCHSRFLWQKQINMEKDQHGSCIWFQIHTCVLKCSWIYS
jgi:hypothetical protein